MTGEAIHGLAVAWIEDVFTLRVGRAVLMLMAHGAEIIRLLHEQVRALAAMGAMAGGSIAGARSIGTGSVIRRAAGARRYV